MLIESDFFREPKSKHADKMRFFQEPKSNVADRKRFG